MLSSGHAGIAVLVSGGGTNLQALIDAKLSGKLKSGSIAVVISSSPDAYALTRAEKNGIPTVVCDRKAYPDAASFEAAISEGIERYEADLIILAGFMCILSSNFVKHYVNIIINVHPSLIPSFCGKGFYGLKVHEAALARGVKLTGATVHYVNEIPDGGEIIAQRAVRVLRGDTPETLQKRVMRQAEWVILPKAAEAVCKKIVSEAK